MAALADDVVASLEGKLTEAVRAGLGLPAAERPAFIGKYLLAGVEGTEPPSAPARVPEQAAALTAEMPELAAQLSRVVNDATKSGVSDPYIEHKPEFKAKGGRSAVSSSGVGVAKSYYLLENVTFVRGRDNLVKLKRGPTGTNVRMYTSCCATLCVTDCGMAAPQPWTVFNRNCITLADGSPYMPAGVVAANCADNPEAANVPPPRCDGLPDGMQAKLDAVWHPDLEPSERDAHAGRWAISGNDPFFYPDPEKVDEFAVAVVGLEDALSTFIEAEKERARAEAEAAAKKAAEEEEAARVAAEAAAVQQADDELLAANPSQAKVLEGSGMSRDEILAKLRADAEAANKPAEAAGGGSGETTNDDIVSMMAKQMHSEATDEAMNPELQIVTAKNYDADEITRQARAIADEAFKRYDLDGNGTIDKEELFDMCLTVGQVAPQGATTEEKRHYLEQQWALADTNGDGTVDFQEFVDFYVCTLEALAAEEAARHAFAKYDVDNSNSLEKHELFQVLFELDMVPGHDAYEKRVYLEEQFIIADANGDGHVDFSEFVAFYTAVLHDSRKSDVVFSRRRKNKQAREARAKRAVAYVQPESVVAAVKSRELALLSAHWVLEQAGYTKTEVVKRGVSTTKWTKADAAPTPLPHRQAIEADAELSAKAFLSFEAFEKHVAAYTAIKEAGGRAFESTAIAALPIVLASHCWETAEAPDPEGRTLAAIATNLARQMATYQNWGFDDVGVFFDYSCMYQAIDGGAPRTPEQEVSHRHAVQHLPVWFSHRMTTVYLVPTPEGVLPEREARGWGFFERALTRLFKETPPPKPFKVRGGALVPFWTKLVDLGSAEVADDPNGVNPQAGAPKVLPPLSADHFEQQLRGEGAHSSGRIGAPKAFPCAEGKEKAERDLLEHLYRAAVEDGFNSLGKLQYARLGWTDADISELGSLLMEVPCPNVTELDLSWNDMRDGSGFTTIGDAIGRGSLHSLQRLNLINCTAIKQLPESLEELLELSTVMLDGCVQLKSLQELTKLASLRHLQIINCHGLGDDALKPLPASAKVIRSKEELEEMMAKEPGSAR